jgi:hypothetical protein
MLVVEFKRLTYFVWSVDLYLWHDMKDVWLHLKYFPQTETLNQYTTFDKRMKQDMW